ncbi:MAG: hypothetical protein HZB43_10880 [candidate division Zixibacteria bacterium]|nr:hypothetical protein [candidate division Zixibacteria bacterium]
MYSKGLKSFLAIVSIAVVSLICRASVYAQCSPAAPTTIGDVNGDAGIDVFDVIGLIGIAFSGEPASHFLGSEDINGDGGTDVFDVISVIGVAFSGDPTVFPPRVYPLTGRIGQGSRQLVKDPAMQYRIYGVWSIGSDTVNGSTDTVSVCQKTDTLIIPPGVVVQGDSSRSVPSALVVRRTGYILAVGTAAEPVVLTSMMPVGSRNRSDWGGVVINGAAPNNNRPSYMYNTEGGLNVGKGGGNIPNDNSGCLVYVREEFSGREFSLDNELNGITLNSVGSGTTLEYVQVNASADDGIEWFGGTVNIKHAVISNYDDDSFDTDLGTPFKGQFLLAVQDRNAPGSANHESFEWDNHPDPATEYEDLPRNMPTVYNTTHVGMGHEFIAAPNEGVHMRRGTAGQIFNTVWTRFRSAVDFDHAPTTRLITADSIHIGFSVWYDCGRWADDADSLGNEFKNNPVYSNQVYLNPTANPALAPILVAASFGDVGFPDFRPITPANPIGLDVAAGATPPNDGFFDPTATYLGCVKANDPAPWYSGWTNWDEH